MTANDNIRAQEVLSVSLENRKDAITDKVSKDDLNIILKHSESGRGVLAVVITSLVKKAITPEQDIRKHQKGMDGGYSGRGLDTATITPFLTKNKFPFMGGGSGWLTRSLEQPFPYTLDYKGAIKPTALKVAFLKTLDRVESGKLKPIVALEYLFFGLAAQRDSSLTFRLAKPTGLSIETIVHYLDEHFKFRYDSAGASRLPVLAVYAAYTQMMVEVGRYKTWKLPSLLRHNAADRKTDMIGDIQVLDEKDKIVEAIEIKHNIAITATMIQAAYDKFKTHPVKRYYLLTTKDDGQNTMSLSDKIIEIQRKAGCQVIVNGVEPTLKYYLRLLKNPDTFIIAYIELLEKDQDIKYEQKEAWNTIVSGGK